MSRIEKRRSEPAFTVATTDHDLRGDYSQAATDFTITQDWNAYSAAEHALWSSVRALREREMLLRRMASVSASLGEQVQAEAAVQQADRISVQASALQEFAESAPADLELERAA